MRRVDIGRIKNGGGGGRVGLKKLRSTHAQSFKPGLTLQIMFKIRGHKQKRVGTCVAQVRRPGKEKKWRKEFGSEG